MQKTIKECRPSILVEVLDARPTLMKKIENLRENGYVACYMHDSGLELCGPEISVPENQNLLLIHESKHTPTI